MKNKIRKEYIQIRKNILNKDIKSDIIFNKIINLKIYKEAKVIALYKSMNNEVNTDKLIEYSYNKKIILLPKVNQDNMYFYKIDKNTKYKLSNIGVKEPINIEIYKDKIDLLIVPLVVFDNECNRIGFGKAYYDKYLTNNNVPTIGIAFEEQKYQSIIPIEEHDKKLDLIITDKKVYYKK